MQKCTYHMRTASKIADEFQNKELNFNGNCSFYCKSEMECERCKKNC